jgi:RHS repeat-associated protein
LAQHLYFPFGEEATSPEQDAEALKFTGHERDDLDASGTTRDLDYMHARYFSAHLGRFFSPDKVPVIRKAMKSPQRWNLYTYVASNPLKYIDPSGNILIVLNAQEVEDALDELNALKQALLEAGAEEAADTLQTEVISGEVRITSGGVDLSDSDNPTVALIGSAINTEARVGVQITNRDLSSHGGALTESVGPPGDPNRITISINPSQLSSTVAPGRVAAGPLTGMQLGLTYSAGTALVHELGHAYGYYEQGYDRFPVWGQTNATALRYENLHRALIADPRGPLLARYPVERVRH